MGISDGTIQALFDEANRQMTVIVCGFMQRGIYSNVNDATAAAVRLCGQDAAESLENTLRMMGAHDVKVTCP